MQDLMDSVRRFTSLVPDMSSFKAIMDPEIPSLGAMPLIRENEVLETIGERQLTAQEEQNELIKKLIETIETNDKKNDELGKRMWWLAFVGVLLTATQVIPAIDTLNNWFHFW